MNDKLFFKWLVAFILILTISSPLSAQQKTVTGKVIQQQTNEPMQGVTVTVKGTDRSTLTGADGSFSMSVPNNRTVLVFSYIGFASREIGLGRSASYTVALAPGANQLDEVVVVGFGTTKRRDLTGAIVSVKPEEITARPGPNPMESLQGRVAGL